MDRKDAQEAERCYAAIDADMKALALLTDDHHSYKVTLSISATPRKAPGDYYHPNAVDLPIRGDDLLGEVRRFATRRLAVERARSRIAERNRRLAQLGFEQVSMPPAPPAKEDA